MGTACPQTCGLAQGCAVSSGTLEPTVCTGLARQHVSDDGALTVSNPGTGVLELAWDYGTPIDASYNLAKLQEWGEWSVATNQMTSRHDNTTIVRADVA